MKKLISLCAVILLAATGSALSNRDAVLSGNRKNPASLGL